MTNHPKSRAAFEAWKRVPSASNRDRLREAIASEGGTIVGHGVIGWARQHLLNGTARSEQAEGEA